MPLSAFERDARPAVRATLLGPFRLICAGERVDGRLSTQAATLCAMLLLRRHDPAPRREIAFTLWPDLSEAEALAALRRHVYVLQHALPPSTLPWILCDARYVGWGRPDETEVDALEFERLARHGEMCEAAVAAYHGDFLQYIDHEWVAGVRERFRRTFTRTLELAIRARIDRDDLLGAFDLIERLLQHDPWREDVMRDFMLLRAQLGDRAGALFAYRDFSRRLRAELDVEPMPETQQCYNDIARGHLPRTSGVLSA